MHLIDIYLFFYLMIEFMEKIKKNYKHSLPINALVLFLKSLSVFNWYQKWGQNEGYLEKSEYLLFI
jgi:hypothetical protein